VTVPGFNAEASLYQKSGQYRTGRYTINLALAARMTDAIHPAKEVIEVHGCRQALQEAAEETAKAPEKSLPAETG
jgi:hypothetical protein